MAVGSYINADSAIQKTTGIYVGDHDGTARKVAKGYLGDADGIARLWFHPETAKPSRLPEGYTEVEYISNSGSPRPYINTGVYPAKELRIDIDIGIPGSLGSGYLYFVGSNVYVNKQNEYFSIGNYSAKVIFSYYNKEIELANALYEGGRYNLSLDACSGTCSCNDTSKSFLAVNNAFQYNRAIYLLAASAGTSNVSYPPICNLYSCQMYNSGILIRDFVPCISPNGIVGLYDAVNGRFYASLSATVFTPGPAV